MQSDIFKHALSVIKNKLQENSPGKYAVVNDFSSGEKPQVRLVVTDLFQAANDKIGQRIIIEEKMYEAPALYVMNLRIIFSGKSQEDVLSVYGLIASYFKVHNTYDCEEYNWHGNNKGKFFLEPVIRKEPENCNEYLYLDYRIELKINSTKAENFVRVEKKNLSANQIK